MSWLVRLFVLVVVAISFCAGAHTDEKKGTMVALSPLTPVGNSSLIMSGMNSSSKEELQGALAMLQDGAKMIAYGLKKTGVLPKGFKDQTDWGPEIIKKMTGMSDMKAKIVFAGVDAAATTIIVTLFPPAGTVVAAHAVASAVFKAYGDVRKDKKAGNAFNAKKFAINLSMGVAGAALAIVTGIDGDIGTDVATCFHSAGDVKGAAVELNTAFFAGVGQNAAGDATGIAAEYFTVDNGKETHVSSVKKDGTVVDTSQPTTCGGCLKQNNHFYPGSKPTDNLRVSLTKKNWCGKCVDTATARKDCGTATIVWLRKWCA